MLNTKLGKTVQSLVQEEDEVISFAIGSDPSCTLVSSHKSGLLRHWTWNGYFFNKSKR